MVMREGQRYLCVKPWGWRHYRWIRDPIPAPPPPTRPPPPGLTAEQQLQAWALATGNAGWSRVFLTDTNQLAADEALTPSILTGPRSMAPPSISVTPSGQLQTSITTDAQALVTDATAALAAPPPGNFTASWDALMTDQVNYGTSIAGDPGDWGAYTFSQPDANAAYGMAGTDDLTAIEAVGITVPAAIALRTGMNLETRRRMPRRICRPAPWLRRFPPWSMITGPWATASRTTGP
jgi:hypothetical protein